MKYGKKSMLKAALAYVELLKWPVFPVHSMVDGICSCGNDHCSSSGKHPKTYNGVKSATTDLQVVKVWWNKWPNANIGIATGEKSGFFVLDIDIKGDGPDSLEELIELHEPLPETVVAVTGSFGSHYLFKHCEGIKNKVALFPGIDVRGDGGYIVVSPSNHISGRDYEWELCSRPIETPIAAAPNWLIDLVKEPNGNCLRKSEDYWVGIIKGVETGNRNNAAASLVGHLLRRGVASKVAYELLLLWNDRCNPPQSIEAIERTFKSILKKEIERRGVRRT